MNRLNAENFIESFMGAEACFPFGPEPLVYKVKGKMFALLAEHEGKDCITLKADPAAIHFLVDEFSAVRRGYHMNKKHWITVNLAGDASSELIEGWISDSYSLVVSSLTKAQKAQLTLGV